MSESEICSCKNLCKPTSQIVWAQVAAGYRIEHLENYNYDIVVALIKKYYFKNEHFFKASSFLTDEKSMEVFIERIYQIMDNKSSLVVIDESTKEVVGVLLLTIVHKLEFGRQFSSCNLKHGAALEKFIELKNNVCRKVDFFLDFNTDVLLRFYLICVKDKHLNHDLEFNLFRAGFELARHLRIPIATGVFTSSRQQQIAKRVGFEIVHSINYTDWFHNLHDISNQRVVVLMVAKIPDFYNSPIVYDEKGKGKSTKKEKK